MDTLTYVSRDTITDIADAIRSRCDMSHVYEKTGNYTITLAPQDGCELQLGYEYITDSTYVSYGVLIKNYDSSGAICDYMYANTLQAVEIGDGVTSIGSYAFAYCYSTAEYHVMPTTPPTLSSTNAFKSIPNECIIYVPTGYLETYQSATNWSTYASYMQEETE